jgi:hypothetical protein
MKDRHILHDFMTGRVPIEKRSMEIKLAVLVILLLAVSTLVAAFFAWGR